MNKKQDIKFHKELINAISGYIADQLEVSVPTVKRWIEGRNLPHPKMYKSILKSLSRK